jgi:hypothetical protein
MSTMSKWAQISSMGSKGPSPICSRTRSEMRFASALKPRRKGKSDASKLVVGAEHNLAHQLGVLAR